MSVYVRRKLDNREVYTGGFCSQGLQNEITHCTENSSLFTVPYVCQFDGKRREKGTEGLPF